MSFMRRPRLLITFFALSLLCAALPGCGSLRPTSRVDGTFVGIGRHAITIMVDTTQMDSTSSLTNTRTIPLGDQFEVINRGKPSSISKLENGQRLHIVRDDETRRVIRIEAE
jgi:hypothetical protein